MPCPGTHQGRFPAFSARRAPRCSAMRQRASSVNSDWWGHRTGIIVSWAEGSRLAYGTAQPGSRPRVRNQMRRPFPGQREHRLQASFGVGEFMT